MVYIHYFTLYYVRLHYIQCICSRKSGTHTDTYLIFLLRLPEPQTLHRSQPKAVNLNGDFRSVVTGTQGAVLTKDESFGKDSFCTPDVSSQASPA
jgi:hypothetical protein